MAGEFGVEVPEHTILAHLGHGGMARVFLARDEAIGRLVALKVIDAKFDTNSQFLKRFEREARTAGGLSHPHIVPIHRFGLTVDGRPYLTMTYVEGGSLRDKLRRCTKLPVEEALRVARQVASALQAAHARQIVHRDLKPDNVLFQGESAFLTDFGIAKLLDVTTGLTGTGANPGTVRYFSPEQALERPVDARSDIYSLGVVLYEMLSGKRPIEGDTVATLMLHIAYNEPTPLPAALRGLQPLMDVMLAKDPADRLGSGLDVCSVIDAMVRNWLRNEDVDGITNGINFRPSRAPAANVDLDDPANISNQASRVSSSSIDGGDTAPTQLMSETELERIRKARPSPPRAENTATNARPGPLESTRVMSESEAARVRGPRPIAPLDASAVSLKQPAAKQSPMPIDSRAMRARGRALLITISLASVTALTMWLLLSSGPTKSSVPVVTVLDAPVPAVVVSNTPLPPTRISSRPPTSHTDPAPTSAPVPAWEGDASLFALLDGRWSFGSCKSSETAKFSISNGRLSQQWPKTGLADEQIVSADRLSITTEVITPAANKGERFRYSPSTKYMMVEDFQGDRTELMTRCN